MSYFEVEQVPCEECGELYDPICLDATGWCEFCLDDFERGIIH